MLRNYKVVKTKPGMRWVSWTYKDATCYGFEDEDGNMLERFLPSLTLKGNGLRAHVAKIFEWKQPHMYLGRWPSVAMDANEVLPGHVLVYQAMAGKVVFMRVDKVTPSLIWGTTNDGGSSQWLVDSLDAKLQTGAVQCIALENVPPELCSWDS